MDHFQRAGAVDWGVAGGGRIITFFKKKKNLPMRIPILAVALLGGFAGIGSSSWAAAVTVWVGNQTLTLGGQFQTTITDGPDSWYPRLSLFDDGNGYTKLEIFNGNLPYGTFDGSPEMWFLPDDSGNYLKSFAPGDSISGYAPMNTSNSLYAYASFDGPHSNWLDGTPRAAGIVLFDSNNNIRLASILLSLNTTSGGASANQPILSVYRVEYETVPFADLTVSGLPEPSSASLLIAGTVGLVALKRRRKS